MAIMERISTILRANVNALLDVAEDPEKTLEEVIRDMAEAIGQARGQVAEMIKQEKLLEADYIKNHQLGQQWQEKAELAVTHRRDDLAREALRQRIDFDRNAEILARQLASQQEVVAKIKHDLGKLEQKYNQAVRDRTMLLARHRTAMARQQVVRSVAQLSSLDPSSELARMEERIRQEEARSAAYAEVTEDASLEHQFEALEAEDNLGQQLADLKRRVRGELPGRGAATSDSLPKPEPQSPETP